MRGCGCSGLAQQDVKGETVNTKQLEEQAAWGNEVGIKPWLDSSVAVAALWLGHASEEKVDFAALEQIQMPAEMKELREKMNK